MTTDDLIQGRIIKDLRNKSLKQVLKIIEWNVEQYEDKVEWSTKDFICQHMVNSGKGPAFVIGAYIGEKTDDSVVLLTKLLAWNGYLPRYIVNCTVMFISLHFLIDGVPRPLKKQVHDFVNKYCDPSDVTKFMNEHPECKLTQENEDVS